MRVRDMNWMQMEAYLERDDRCALPLGSIEQHAYLSLATDAVLAERVATEAAEPLGVPVLPALAYGLTPYFMAFPGTVSLSLETYGRVLTEMLTSLARHGFRRVLVVNGHGGNTEARDAVEAWAGARPETSLKWYDWWRAPATFGAVRAVDPQASHASWMEGFPWTRVEGIDVPAGHKEPVDLSGREGLTPEAFRERLGDGCFGGYYARPDEELLAVWKVAVEETRAQLTEGWT